MNKLLVGTPHEEHLAQPHEVKIAKGIPYPTQRARIVPKWDPILKEMAVGDCIKFENERSAKMVMGAASAMRKREPALKARIFRSAKAKDEKGKVFYGIWRAS